MSRTRAQLARTALALAEEQRRARLAAAARDHEERTRRSLLIAGHEVGTIKPTAETEAKLRPDPIVRLVANETLTREQGRAAVEIRLIYERVAGGLLARTGDPANRSPGTAPDLPERIALLHTQRYLPWARYLAGAAAEEPAPAGSLSARPARPARSGKCGEALDIAVAVAIEHRSLNECDAARLWRHGMAAKLLTYALAVYADIAGWERGRDTIAAFEAWWEKREARRR
jgi:hypothetical protein